MMDDTTDDQPVDDEASGKLTLPAGIKITKITSNEITPIDIKAPTSKNRRTQKLGKQVCKKATYIPIKNTSYICAQCAENFTSFELLNNHMKHPCRTTLNECSICDKTFKNKSRLNAHFSTHNIKPKYLCEKCGKELSNTIALQAHLDMMHTDYFDATIDAFACKLCPMKLPSKSQILNHVNLKHLHVSTYLCDLCGKSFLQESGLKAHIFTHSTTKSFICHVCSKSFKMQNTLRAHLQTHNTERRFICDECGKTFKKNYSLVEHKKHHSGDLGFQCNVCLRKFVSKTAHNTHVKTHLIETVSLY